MFPDDFELSKISAFRQHWHGGFTMDHPRPTNALLLFLDAETVCETKDKNYLFKKGDLVLIPQGSEYSWHFSDKLPDNILLLFEFSVTLPDGTVHIPVDRITRLSENSDEMFEMYFNRLVNEFARPMIDHVMIKSHAYALIAEVIRLNRRSRVMTGEFSVIALGIAYLENDVHQTKSIAEIAEMCHVSCTYFEKLFKRYSGMSPSRFRLERKLERAENMLSSGGVTLEAAAEELGFYDSAHLSHIYKKMRGRTPGKSKGN